MKRLELSDLKINAQLTRTQASSIYRLSNGDILKIFSPLTKQFYLIGGISLEKKILFAKGVQNVPEIVIPNGVVYNDGNFMGYTMEYIDGISYNDKYDRLSSMQNMSLLYHANSYSQIESIVKRGNKQGIVFPDLLTCDNIIYDEYGNIKIIDYDGLQIGNYGVISMSTSLGKDNSIYNIRKYSINGIYTPNLDMKSLIILYFLSTFNIDLEATRRAGVPLDQIFKLLGSTDNDFNHKVWKCYQDNASNEFLGSDVYRLADNYTLIPKTQGGSTIKVLVAKR